MHEKSPGAMMKADVQSSAEKEALEWAIKFFRGCSEDLKPHGESALDFAVAERIWRNNQKALDAYINYRVLSVLAYTGPNAAEVRRRYGKPRWNVASSARGLCKYAGLLMARGAPLQDSLRDFVLSLLLDPDVFLKKVSSRGRKDEGLRVRDLRIAEAIMNIVVKWKFKATRIEETKKKSRGPSAASIVREALAKAVNINKGEKAINGIWGGLERIRDERTWLLQPRRTK